MEKDVSKQAGYFIKYGLIVFVGITLIISYAIFSYMDKSETLTVGDAKIAGTFVSIKAQANGKLMEIRVKDGENVTAGDVLATVEVAVTEDTIKQLEQNVALAKENLEQLKKGQDIKVPISTGVDLSAANADLGRAESRKNRMEELFKMGAISKVQRDEAVADFEAAKARATATAPTSFQTVHKDTAPEILESAALNVRQAEAALKRAKEDAGATEITSPIDGAFYLANIEEGSEIHAGERLFNIGDATNMWIEARLSAEMISKIHLGELVTYEINGKKLFGTVTEIEEELEADENAPQATEGVAPKVEGSDGKRAVKISLADEALENLKPGATVSVTFRS